VGLADDRTGRRICAIKLRCFCADLQLAGRLGRREAHDCRSGACAPRQAPV